MPIPELQKLRERYPQYNDIDDVTLVNKIATKYPQYSDLVDKVQQPTTPTAEPQVGFFGKVPLSEYQAGRRNWMGDIMDRPSSMTRAAIRKDPTLAFLGPLAGLGGLYKPETREATISGATQPNETFQSEALRNFTPKTQSTVLNFAGGLPASTLGLGADILTDPVTALLSIISQAPLGRGRTVGSVVSSSKPAQAIKRVANAPIQLPKPNLNFLRGGLSKAEVKIVTQEYGGSNATLVDMTKNKAVNKFIEADNMYKKAITNFKGNQINSQEFFNTLQNGLRKKGWIDLQGNPTTRFQQGLDPVMDKLTNMYLDLKNISTNKGTKIIGQIMSKEDFSTYRDALGNMLKEKPSDNLVMSARNSLYNSAEKSGMRGIKVARDLEKESYLMEKKFINRNTGDLKITEQKLSKIGTKHPPSKQELDHIKELEKYTGQPIISEAEKINKLNRGLERTKNIKKYGAGVAGGLLLGGLGRNVAKGSF